MSVCTGNLFNVTSIAILPLAGLSRTMYDGMICVRW